MKPVKDSIQSRPPEISSTEDGTDSASDRLRQFEKEVNRLNFMLDRAVKEKQTLSTLLARTSDDLEKSSEIIKKMFGPEGWTASVFLLQLCPA